MTRSDLLDQAMELLADNARDTLTGKQLVDWATQLLGDGIDLPPVVRLAGLDLDARPQVSEAMPLFRLALEQLGVSVSVDRETLLRAHLRRLARMMSGGRLPLSDGVARVEREVLMPLGHPEDLRPWCYVGSDIHPDTLGDLTGHAWERYVLSLAREAATQQADAADEVRDA